MRVGFTILLVVLCTHLLTGQYFLELHSEYDDSFRSWEMVLEQDSSEIEGSLELVWGIGNDFSEWRYQIEDYEGIIKQTYRNNPGFWELRADDRVIGIRQVWPGDFTEWKISFEGRSFTFRTLYNNRADEWVLKDQKLGELVLYSESPRDPRDWIVNDYMIEAITLEERMAAIFIALFSSIPKQ